MSYVYGGAITVISFKPKKLRQSIRKYACMTWEALKYITPTDICVTQVNEIFR